MNSLPRWLISITHMPVPCQSSISSPARASTSSGSTAGPALKLKIRDISGSWVPANRAPDRPAARRIRPCPPLPLPPLPLPSSSSRSTIRSTPASFSPSRERDQRHALRRAALLADLRHRGADQHAAGGDQHHLVVVVDQDGAHQGAVALRGLDRDHALAAAAVLGVLGDRRALAVAVLGGGEHRLLLVLRHQHADHALAAVLGQAHAAHAGRLAAHRRARRPRAKRTALPSEENSITS